MNTFRTRLALCVAAAALGLGTTVAQAQGSAAGYPNHSIRFILPFPPGGGTDIIGRLLAQKLSEEVAQPVVPDNRPGAGGNIGAEAAVKAPNDGYTIVICTVTLAISPALYKSKLAYDPVRDLEPIGLVASNVQVLAIHPSMPAHSVKELVALAKRQPGSVSFGTGGVGTSNDLVAHLFRSHNHVNVLIVPYKGISPATVAILSGEVGAAVVGVATAVPYVKAGKLRALAVLGPHRVTPLPGVPTAAEAGAPELEAVLWYGMFAPAGTPRPIIDKLSKAFAKIVAQNDTKEKLAKVGAETMTSGPEELGAFFRKEMARWGKIVDDAGISVK